MMTLSKEQLKYFVRKLRGAVIIRLDAGMLEYPMFVVQNSTKGTYHEAILSYTITTLMC